MAGRAQPPALDGGEVLAHAVDLADRGARAQQRAGHRLLVRKRDPRRRQGEQRRAAAGDQAEREIVRTQRLGLGEDARRRRAAAGVRHRVRRLDHVDRARRHAVAVAGDDEAFQRAVPMILHGPRHRRRRLAGADDHAAACGRFRQVRGQAMGRLRALDGRVQQAAQQGPRLRAHAPPCQSRRQASFAPDPRTAGRAPAPCHGEHPAALRVTMPAPGVAQRYGSGDTGARP